MSHTCFAFVPLSIFKVIIVDFLSRLRSAENISAAGKMAYFGGDDAEVIACQNTLMLSRFFSTFMLLSISRILFRVAFHTETCEDSDKIPKMLRRMKKCKKNHDNIVEKFFRNKNEIKIRVESHITLLRIKSTIPNQNILNTIRTIFQGNSKHCERHF